MKIFFIILSLYSFALSIHPCADRVESLAVSSQADNHEGEDDTCSPFCTCSCCGTAGFEPAAVNPITGSTFSKSSQLFFYHPPLTHEVNIDFWQPPRIG